MPQPDYFMDFVACWNADGQALRIAEDMGIEIYNLHDIKRADDLWKDWG